MSSTGYQSYPEPGPMGSSSSGYPQAAYPSQAAASNVGPAVVSPYSPNLSPHFSSSTVLLLLLSLVSLYEGTLRVIQNSNSNATWDTSYNYFPAAAVLIGGIWESLYSLLTIFIAIWALLFDWHSITLTSLALLTQLGGWYTVVVFALAQPSYNYNHSLEPSGQIFPILNSDESRSAYIFGWVFPLLAVDTAVLGGLMFFTIQLLQIQENKVDELHSPHYYGRRLAWWSFLLLFLGVSQIIYAGIEVDKNTRAELAAPIFFYPNVTSYASIIAVSGCLFSLCGLFGLFASCSNNLMCSNGFIFLCWITFLWVVGGHVMASCVILGSYTNAAGYGLAELGMFFGSLLIPMYLAYKAATIETVERGHYGYGPAQYYPNRPMMA